MLLGSFPVGAFSGISYNISVYKSLYSENPNSVSSGFPSISLSGYPFGNFMLMSSAKLNSS